AAADQHLPIRPGTDALLLLAMLQVLFEDGRADLRHLAAFSDGLPLLREAAARFPPERVADRTGISADAIRELARAFATAQSAVAYGRVGASTQEFGGLTAWLGLALNAVTGHLDREGGSVLTSRAVDACRSHAARRADLILPPSFGFERDRCDLVVYVLSVRNAARYVEALGPPPPGVRDDFAVLLDLALSLRRHGGGRRGRALGAVLRAARMLGERRLLDLMLRFGPHRLSLRKLRRKPHGIDLGPLRPQLPARLGTPGKRVQLAPPIFLRDLERLEASLAQCRADRVLIGRRALRSNNSWMHNSLRLVKGPPGCVLLMHPDDAAARGLTSGARARVASRVGSIEVPVGVTSDVARGVVSLPHGWGHT